MIKLNLNLKNKWDNKLYIIESIFGEEELISALTGHDYIPLLPLCKSFTVLSYIEGENDGAEFHWLCKTDKDELFYIVGSCDYTGWGCQDDVNVTPIFTFEELHLNVPEFDSDNRKIREQFYHDLINIKFNKDFKEEILG